MTRAYIRLDPAFVDHKCEYPDGAYAALIDVFCYAEMQPVRGHFRNEAFLKALLGKRAKWIAYLIEQRDLEKLPDGRLYVVGWEEWQEGDWKVGERVRRIRQRKEGVTTAVDAPVTVDVTVATVQGARLDLSDKPSGAKRSEAEPSGAPQDDDPLDAWYRLTASWPSPRIAPWLERLANDHGPAELIAALAVEWKADPDRATVLGRVETRLKREAHERRKAGDAAAKARAEQERRAIEEMPIEQRAANMARLREEMARAGLLPKEEAA